MENLSKERPTGCHVGYRLGQIDLFLALKGAVVALALQFFLFLALDGKGVVALGTMNLGSTFIGGLYTAKRAPSMEVEHGAVAGLLKGIIDQTLLTILGRQPSLLGAAISLAFGTLGGVSWRAIEGRK